MEIRGCFKHGELVFKYILEDLKARHDGEQHGYHQNAGLGLWGTILEVRGEKVKIGMDIDNGESSEECFLNLIKDSIKIITDSSLGLEDDFQVLSGNYMEQPAVLWCTRTGEAQKYEPKEKFISNG